MSRHVLDHQNARTDDGAKTYVEIERTGSEAGPHPATISLQRRTREASPENRRAQAYLRADRGEGGKPLV